MKPKRQRTLGDRIREQKKRDKLLEQEYRKKHHEIKVTEGNTRVEQIIHDGHKFCSACETDKPIGDFYVLSDSAGKVTKIFPDCKKCMGDKRRGERQKDTKRQIIDCFKHYNKYTSKKLVCAKCGYNKFSG